MHKIYLRNGQLGLRGLSIMITNELKALKANKHIIYGGILSPVLYFLFYSFGIQSTFGNISYNGVNVSFLSYSMIGIFAMSLFKEMYHCVYRMVIDKCWGLLSLKLLNGVRSPLYIIGISTFPIIGVLLQVVIVYCLSALCGGVFPVVNFLQVLLFLIFCIIFWSSALLCVALLINNYKQRDFVMQTLLLPVLFAAPLFYSLENAPIVLRLISKINPLTYQVEAMRSIAFGIPQYVEIWVTLILAIIAFVLANICLSRVDFKSDEH